MSSNLEGRLRRLMTAVGDGEPFRAGAAPEISWAAMSRSVQDLT